MVAGALKSIELPNIKNELKNIELPKPGLLNRKLKNIYVTWLIFFKISKFNFALTKFNSTPVVGLKYFYYKKLLQKNIFTRKNFSFV